ncbi:hypothetical protein Back2_10980 [Nocardioides baekrokdamisoli]|uniref:Potassium transporter TrkA n=1 Tax=Nocardioides baekrokdamisoli TaxID=1804624 RepID=A0A3G9IT59_9ACTN|nr:NAD-binding protein [Nocardioides baekrokdamisoli]BBH16811.1 hypothetical protein Back2_10980 [Nocardioides baekrokdamisoli]
MTAGDDPRNWAGHVIVCGLDDDGVRVVEQLDAAGARVVVVDESPAPATPRELEALGIPLIKADPRLPETLESAGARRASAIVCIGSDDLLTLATALLAHELHPGIRVVVQVHNASVGRALGAINASVLDVARLASASIIEAALGHGVRQLQLGPNAFAVANAKVRRDGSLRSLYGDLAPLAIMRPDGTTELSPGRDTEVSVGERVVMIGSPAGIEGAGLGQRKRHISVVESRDARRSLVRDVVAGVDRPVRYALTALMGLVLISVAVLRLGYHDGRGHMSILDALYFTVETIGTVGFGDFYFRDQPEWLRIWAIGLMIVGAILATVFFAMLTNMLVTRRLAETLGRRRITGLVDHVIVIGAGSVGVAVVDSLVERGKDVVVIDADDSNRYLGHLRDKKVPVVIADATQPETLSDAGLDRARGVAVLTSDDLANIETGLAIRDMLGERWAKVPVVLRLFEPRLMKTVTTSFGFGFVRSPAALAAPWFVGAAFGLHVIDTFYVADRPMLVARMTVSKDGLAGRAMGDLSAQIRVVALLRADGASDLAPRRDTRFEAGDTAYLVGPYEELLQLLRGDALAT